jgi:hypothetical protein
LRQSFREFNRIALPENLWPNANLGTRMKGVSSEVNLKATVAAIVIYATAMGLVGDYWAVQCGSHWFTYSVIGFLPYALPGVFVAFLAVIWLLSQYNFGHVRYWLLAGTLSVLFFVGCFVFAHMQPAMQLYNGNDCQPF